MKDRERKFRRVMCYAYWVLGMQQNSPHREEHLFSPLVLRSQALTISVCVCVCVWCATPYWEYLNSNPAVIYWITYQIWVNSDTHAMIQARRARVAVLEIPLWCFLCKYQQILLSDTSVRTQTDTHTHSAVFSGWRSCPILNILLVSAAKCNLLHWSTHACTYTRS